MRPFGSKAAPSFCVTLNPTIVFDAKTEFPTKVPLRDVTPGTLNSLHPFHVNVGESLIVTGGEIVPVPKLLDVEIKLYPLALV